MTPIKVVLVDDHPLVTEGIHGILNSYDDISVIGTLCDGDSIIREYAALKPDVILMDLNMPGMGGLAATEILLEQDPDCKILVLSMHDSPEYIATAMRHGAKGYLLKDIPTDQIVTAIKEVHEGRTYMCTGTETKLAAETPPARDQLTSREQDILLQLASGKSNKEVAFDFDISIRTVETHRKNIKRKLGIRNTADLTRYAIEHGVLR